MVTTDRNRLCTQTLYELMVVRLYGIALSQSKNSQLRESPNQEANVTSQSAQASQTVQPVQVLQVDDIEFDREEESEEEQDEFACHEEVDYEDLESGAVATGDILENELEPLPEGDFLSFFQRFINFDNDVGALDEEIESEDEVEETFESALRKFRET